MAQEKTTPGNIDRREMLLRIGSSSAALMIPACGSGEEQGNNQNPTTLEPTASNTGTQAPGSTSAPGSSTAPPASTPAANTSSPGTTAAPSTSSTPSDTTPATPSTSAPATSTAPAETTEGGGGTPGAEPSTSATTSNDPEATGGAGGEIDPGGGGAGGTEPSAGGSGNTPTNGELTVPPWDDVPTCTPSATDGAAQGPFFIHEDEKDDDVVMFRQDIRGKFDPDAEDGIELQLHLRVLDTTNDACNGAPVGDVEVYIWHTDGQGYYSGFGLAGTETAQYPDEPYMGQPDQNDLQNADRFCRGAQVSNADGVVSFRSIFPGWYNGRDVHIHLVILKRGSTSLGRMTYSGGDHIFTTQLYFDPEFTASVHTSAEPYARRTMLSAYQGAIQADEGGNSGLRFKASFEGGVVVAQMQILLDPASSVVSSGGGGFGF